MLRPGAPPDFDCGVPFTRARETLARGGAIAIFPEGTTHSDPRLKSLKTGAARIALGASLPHVVVIPTGLFYTSKQTFRSAVVMYFGEPIDVTPAAVDDSGEPPRPMRSTRSPRASSRRWPR